MPSLRYRNAYISIFHIPDKSGNSSCIDYVEIRHKLEGSPSARLVLNGPFSDAHPAREHAFAMEKERIDDWLASKGKSAPSGQIATEAGGDLPAVSTGLGVGSHRWHLPVLCVAAVCRSGKARLEGVGFSKIGCVHGAIPKR